MIKAIIENKLTEEKYTVYNSVYDLKTLSDYYSKLPKKPDATKFVKFIRVTSGQFGIYNISDIKITPNVVDGSEGKKIVQIVYTGDEASKVWSVNKFASMCKKIFNSLKNLDEMKDVEVQAVLEGQEKPTKFRFYYDSDTGFAILVNGTNTKGLEDFLNAYEGDLMNAVNVPKSTKAPKAPAKTKEQRKEKRALNSLKELGYICVDKTDEFGHKIRMWKKDTSKDMLDKTDEV